MTAVRRLVATGTLYRRSLRELASLGPQTLVVPLVVPTFILVVYASLFSQVFVRLHVRLPGVPGFGSHPHYLQYVLAAPMVMAALLATASAGVGVAVERQLGFYDRMQLSPLGPSVSQVARRLADGTRIAAFVTILSVVAWLAGASIRDWPLGLAVTIPLTAALGVAYGGLTFSLCLRSGSAEAAQAVTPLFFPFLFMSTAFAPPPLVPGWIHTVAGANPLSAVCDTVRLAFLGHVDAGSLLRSVAGVAAIAVVTQLLIVRAERRVANR